MLFYNSKNIFIFCMRISHPEWNENIFEEIRVYVILKGFENKRYCFCGKPSFSDLLFIDNQTDERIELLTLRVEAFDKNNYVILLLFHYNKLNFVFQIKFFNINWKYHLKKILD